MWNKFTIEKYRILSLYNITISYDYMGVYKKKINILAFYEQKKPV